MATCPKCRAHYDDDATECEVDGEPLLPDETAKSLLADLEPGQTVGEYRIETKLGQGGFGAVYRAVHPVIGKPAAVKVLNQAFSSDPQMVSRFIAEARAANTIRNEHIIDIFSFGTLDDGRHYFVMELLEGQSLEQLIRASGALDPGLLVLILVGVADGLDAAHAKGIVHRDLKPDNIYVTTGFGGRPQAKLLDFGVAKLLGGRSMGSHRTHTGTPVGTPLYMSPEQCLGLDIDVRTDVYAFGIVCFEGLAGKPPFTGDSYLGLMNQHAQAPRPLVSQHNPALGTSFDEPVAQMMAIVPDDRPPSAGDALLRLVEAAERAGIALDALAPAPRASGPGVLQRAATAISGGTVRSSIDKISGELAEAATLADPQQSTPARLSGPQPESAALRSDASTAPSADPPSPKRPTSSRAATATPAPTSHTGAPRPPQRSFGALWWVAAALALAAGIYAFAALPGPRAGRTATDSTVATASHLDEPFPSSRSTDFGDPTEPGPALPAEVTVRLQCETRGAVAYREGRRLGLLPGSFTFPRSTEPQTWSIRAPGHRTVELQVDLSKDQTYSVVLERAGRSTVRPKYSAGEVEEPRWGEETTP